MIIDHALADHDRSHAATLGRWHINSMRPMRTLPERLAWSASQPKQLQRARPRPTPSLEPRHRRFFSSRISAAPEWRPNAFRRAQKRPCRPGPFFESMGPAQGRVVLRRLPGGDKPLVSFSRENGPDQPQNVYIIDCSIITCMAAVHPGTVHASSTAESAARCSSHHRAVCWGGKCASSPKSPL